MKCAFCSTLLIFLIVSCTPFNHIKKFKADKNLSFKEVQPIYIKDIEPLKNDWPELYYYIIRGHFRTGNPDLYLSPECYNYIRYNRARIYESKYLSDYNNFKKVFGEHSSPRSTAKGYSLDYSMYRVGENGVEFDNRMISIGFDKEWKLLLH